MDLAFTDIEAGWSALAAGIKFHKLDADGVRAAVHLGFLETNCVSPKPGEFPWHSTS